MLAAHEIFFAFLFVMQINLWVGNFPALYWEQSFAQLFYMSFVGWGRQAMWNRWHREVTYDHMVLVCTGSFDCFFFLDCVCSAARMPTSSHCYLTARRKHWYTLPAVIVFGKTFLRVHFCAIFVFKSWIQVSLNRCRKMETLGSWSWFDRNLEPKFSSTPTRSCGKLFKNLLRYWNESRNSIHQIQTLLPQCLDLSYHP